MNTELTFEKLYLLLLLLHHLRPQPDVFQLALFICKWVHSVSDFSKYMYICMYTYINIYISSAPLDNSQHALYMQVGAQVVGIPEYVCICMYTYIHTYTHLPSSSPTFFSSLSSFAGRYIGCWNFLYVDTYMHVYIHTYICLYIMQRSNPTFSSPARLIASRYI